jgi:hypothetical protein
MRPGFSSTIKCRKRRRIGQDGPPEAAIYEVRAVGVKLRAIAVARDLREKANFLSRIKLIWVVQTSTQKYSAS